MIEACEQGPQPFFAPVRRSLFVEDGGDLRIVDVRLVVPVEAGVDDLRQLLALERLDRRLHHPVADADRVLGDRAGLSPDLMALSAPCRSRSR